MSGGDAVPADAFVRQLASTLVFLKEGGLSRALQALEDEAQLLPQVRAAGGLAAVWELGEEDSGR